MKYIGIIFFLFLFDNIRGTTIQGVLIDSKTQLPIPYANVYLNKYSGAISNLDGKFILFIKDYNPNDTLQISCVGYNRNTTLLKDFDTIGINKLYIIPVVYILNPIEIKTTGTTPYELLRDAFKKIEINYQTEKHYYKGTYYEQINNFDIFRKWHSRTVNSALIIEDPGYDKLHNNLFDNILENIYILGICKNNDSLNYHFKNSSTVNEANYLKWTLQRNFCRYKSDYFSSPNTYNYNLKQSYYDSTLNTNILEIKITPKNPKEDVVYGEVYISSSDHKIFKIHILYKAEDYPKPIDKKSEDYYRHLNSDIVVIYKPDFSNKMMLSYIKYEFGDGYFYYKQNMPKMIFKKYMEYKTIGEVENGESVIKKLPKMNNSTNIYDQKIMNNKAFWLDYNIVLKE